MPSRDLLLKTLQFLILSSLLLGASAITALAHLERQGSHMTVVGDIHGWPYESINSVGEPRGLLPDIWHLWEKHSGIEVNYIQMPFEQALKALRNGTADAFSGLVDDQARDAGLTPGPAILTVPTSIFFESNMYGITDINDLTGFRIGVVRNSAAEHHLRERYPTLQLALYNNTGEIIAAALAGDLRVFLSEVPSTTSLLSRHKSQHKPTFRHSRPVFTQHLKIQTLNADLTADIITAGFAEIPPQELSRVQSEWRGAIITHSSVFTPWVLGFSAFCLLTAIVVFFT
ncbi:transporter substrate-binding domain-containing protein [Oleidesulfovibrio sp.]|uniref:transporter substrate-binding domain-containing protein n=1 Tax=Oleidesulfovibrio sp. TaxID=2909707 RepID=UPI003A896ED9